MTREEFVAKWADDYIGRLLRAFAMNHTEPLSARWLSAQVVEIDGWLGKLHDALTKELENAQEQSRAGGKPGTASAGGPQAATGAPRNAA